MSDRVLSGTRPTGKLHLGNLMGALENYRNLQSEDSFFMIADLHALTTEYEHSSKIADNVQEVVLDYLAVGLDPDKCTIFVQSEVPEHAELSLLLSMITPLGWLERNPTYKEQMRELKGREISTHGFLGYPVLQAADILLYQAKKVPVGEDQLPHLELTRELVRRFHNIYGPGVFVEPEAMMTNAPRVPGLDGRKMSKSYENCIYISDSAAEVEKKVRAMVTDPARKRREDKGHPEVCPVFFHHQLFNKTGVAVVEKECREALRGCIDCKKEMANQMNAFLDPIRQKRELWKTKKSEITQILSRGREKARHVAGETLAKVMKAMGIR